MQWGFQAGSGWIPHLQDSGPFLHPFILRSVKPERENGRFILPSPWAAGNEEQT